MPKYASPAAESCERTMETSDIQVEYTETSDISNVALGERYKLGKPMETSDTSSAALGERQKLGKPMETSDTINAALVERHKLDKPIDTSDTSNAALGERYKLGKPMETIHESFNLNESLLEQGQDRDLSESRVSTPKDKGQQKQPLMNESDILTTEHTPLMSTCSQRAVAESDSVNQVQDFNDDEDEESSLAGSYPPSSYVTENTDSVTGVLGLSNRVSRRMVVKKKNYLC